MSPAVAQRAPVKPQTTLAREQSEPTLLQQEYELLRDAQMEKVAIELRIGNHRANIAFIEDNPGCEHILKQILARQMKNGHSG